ncbi:MAG TPA: hypothetical protein VK611_05255 [Acidimicrobiales bacterium]|nr:hypothetical protein [Acidimicrobiales bacterium]
MGERGHRRSRIGAVVVAGLGVLLGACIVTVSRLDLGIDLGDRCRESSQEMIAAAAAGDREALAAQLDDGADPNLDVGGRTPLSCAAAAGRQSTVRLLLASGARPGPDALDAAVRGQAGLLMTFEPPVADPGRTAVAELLLDRGVDPDGGPEGPSPLLYAAWSGQTELVSLLLDRGAGPDHGGEVSAAYVLLAQGQVPTSVPTSLPAPRGDTVDNVPPLVGAAWGGHLEIAVVLLDAGADPNLAADGTFSPMLAATARGDRAIVDLLLARGAAPPRERGE